MSKIIDGHVGEPNIFPDVIGEYNISMYGSGDYVLPVGECLGYELVSNNEIHIKDGLFITQGRRGYIKKGTMDICVIENGAQAVNRNDFIVIEYMKDETTMIETHTTKVVKGTAAEEAVDPEIVTGDIPNGDVLHQMPLYRVKIEGLNVVAVEQLFEIGGVAAETVDPMQATLPGFAADALKTREAIDEQNKKIVSCFQLGANRREQLVSALINGDINMASLGYDITEDSTWDTIIKEISDYFTFNYLYNSGDVFSDITGGFQVAGTYSNYSINSNGNLYFYSFRKGSNQSGSYAYMYTANPIRIKGNDTTLCANFTSVSQYYGQVWFYIGTAATTATRAVTVINYSTAASSSGSGTFSIDVSDLQGDYYVGFRLASGGGTDEHSTMYVNKIWIE